MRARVYTTGKVSKAKGVAVLAARIERDGVEPVEFNLTHGLAAHPTPNSAAMGALALGVGTALSAGATELEVYSSSKNAVKAVDGTGGASYETRQDAHGCAYVIYWKSLAPVTFAYRAAKEMPELAAFATAALKRAEAALAPGGAAA